MGEDRRENLMTSASERSSQRWQSSISKLEKVGELATAACGGASETKSKEKKQIKKEKFGVEPNCDGQVEGGDQRVKYIV